MKNYLLFQAYGNSSVKNECKYALLNLLNFDFHKHICPVIYTDDKTFFEELLSYYPEHQFEELDAEKITLWRGAINFVHRVKIEILIDFTHKNEGNILYCDTDTYFIKSPEELFSEIGKGKVFMHEKEGEIDRSRFPSFKKWEAFLTGSDLLSDSSKIAVNKLPMWNAGVIGIPSSQKDLLQDVLQLTDKIYPLFSKHIAEQFSFSYVLSRHFTIQSAKDYVFHYWYLKEFADYLGHQFSENVGRPLPDVMLTIKKAPEQFLEEKMKYESRVGKLKFLLGKWKIKE